MTVVHPPAAKTFDLKVVVPVEDMTELGQPTGDLTGAGGRGREPRLDLAARRRAGARPDRGPPLDDRVRQLAPAGRAADRPAQRARLRAGRRRDRRAAAVAGPADRRESGEGGGAPQIVARAHHGSVSREQRSIAEEELKAGRLPAVVATSSLELGIDMGAVDLVVQVESPPSVASGLQRVGRAGHQVGAVSEGVIFPKYRGDLLECAVVAERMRDGADRVDALPAQRPRRGGPADRRDGRDGADDRRRGRGADPAGRAVRRPAPIGARGRARHAVGPLPVRCLRRAAAAHRLGPRHRRAHPAPGRAAAGRHQRRHDPRPRPVRRLPRRRRGPGPAGRRTRRRDGLRVAGRRRVPARLVVVADRGDHPRPGAGHPGAGPGRADAVLEGRRPRPSGRAGTGDRRVPARDGDRVARPPRPSAARAAGLDDWAVAEPAGLPGRAARRPPATCPTTARSWSSGSATSSATGAWSCTRRSARRSTRPGRWRSRPGMRERQRHRRVSRCTPTTASC